jgi:chemotaxis protein methyltransferase CheR
MRKVGEERVYQTGSLYRQPDILSEDEFKLFRELIYDECGFSFGPEKQTFLEARLRRRMDELGITNALEYYSILKNPTGRSQELPALLDILMICETSFFRNLPQFQLLMQNVLPEIIARKEKAGGRVLRIWSAGCSTGQEPYSAAMAILEALPDRNTWSFRVFASDLSFTALERAQCGIYREDQLKGIDPAYVQKYFRQENGHFLITDQVKRHVVFDYHNLKNDNGLRGLDIIFCRNVLIYLDADEQRRLVNRFASCILPGGYLFLGHAESLQGLSNRFSMLHRNKGIAYRLEV